MNSNWRVTTLDECADFQEGYVNPSQTKSEYFDGPVKWLRAVDLNDSIVENTSRSLTEKGFKSAGKSAYLFEPGTLAISKSGTIGRLGILKDYMCGNRAVINIKPKKEICLPLYLFYFLKKNRQLIEAQATGSVQKNLYTSVLGSIEINLPNLQIQEKIISQLWAIDKKIQSNQKINQTLEEMAQAIFKSWFVDFDPVKAKAQVIAQGGSAQDANLAAMQIISGKTRDQLAALEHTHPEQYTQLHTTASLFPSAFEESELGEIPKGWKSYSAEELIEFNPKESLKKGASTPYIDMASLPTNGSWVGKPMIRDFGSGMKFRNFDTLFARITPCLENGKTAFVQSLPSNTVGWGSTEFIVMRSKKPIPSTFTYLLARSDEFRQHAIKSMTGTSGRQRVPAESLIGYKITTPNHDSQLWKIFGLITDSFFNLINANSAQSETLSKTRDILLPKLLSGEIEV